MRRSQENTPVWNRDPLRLKRLQYVSIRLFNRQNNQMHIPDDELRETDPEAYKCRKKWQRQYKAYRDLFERYYKEDNLVR